ncbi:hypothetical protein N7513_003598 [Penicillium frequentans]|nr:hypothetical protein N7513_003598 [Penicillium glabrum]
MLAKCVEVDIVGWLAELFQELKSPASLYIYIWLQGEGGLLKSLSSILWDHVK